jgi:hypothetical protein
VPLASSAAGHSATAAREQGLNQDLRARAEKVVAGLKDAGNTEELSSECERECPAGKACLLDEWGGSDCFFPSRNDNDCPIGYVCACTGAGPCGIEMISDAPYWACYSDVEWLNAVEER